MDGFFYRRWGLLQECGIITVFLVIAILPWLLLCWGYLSNLNVKSTPIMVLPILFSLISPLPLRAAAWRFAGLSARPCEDGLTYRSLIGRRRMIPWNVVRGITLEGTTWEIGPLSRYFFDGRLCISGSSILNRTPDDPWFPLLARKIRIPLAAYTHPELTVRTTIAYALSQENRPEIMSSEQEEDLRNYMEGLAHSIQLTREWRTRALEYFPQETTHDELHAKFADLRRSALGFGPLGVVVGACGMVIAFLPILLEGGGQLPPDLNWVESTCRVVFILLLASSGWLLVRAIRAIDEAIVAKRAMLIARGEAIGDAAHL